MKIEAELGLIIGAMLAIFFFGYHLGGLSSKTALEASHAAQLSTLASAWQAREFQTQAQDVRHDAEIKTLETDALTEPVVAVRLCASTADPGVPAASAAGRGRLAGAGQLPAKPVEVPGFDVGPYLFRLADRADQIVADCRKTQLP